MGYSITKNEDLERIIYRGSEARDVEFKSSMNWEEAKTKAKVLKAILAFANTPGGGYLIFGIEPKECEPVGMKTKDYDSFDEDNCKDYIGNYTSPYINFSMNKLETDDKKFIVFSVLEFDNFPVMCKKNGPKINNKPSVIKGKLYIRPLKGAYQSCEINDVSEWQQLMLQAYKKNFIERIKDLPCQQENKNINTTEKMALDYYKNERKELINE